MTIRRCVDADFEGVWTIINDGAQAYKNVIAADRWSEPYMSIDKLRHEMEDGVVFWGAEQEGRLAGVMGIQPVRDVTLIRHAYVKTGLQKLGIGSQLLAHLRTLTEDPILIGAWADAVWATRFYERHGFRRVDGATKERLLKAYWNVPERQIETSVVLADEKWWSLKAETPSD